MRQDHLVRVISRRVVDGEGELNRSVGVAAEAAKGDKAKLREANQYSIMHRFRGKRREVGAREERRIWDGGEEEGMEGEGREREGLLDIR